MRGILNKTRSLVAALGLLMALMQPAWCTGLPAPSGKVLLKVNGEIEHTNAEGAAVFDLSMLSSLGVEPLRTVTAWTEGEQLFEGVPLRRVLDVVGARGTRLRAVALNDYESTLALDDPAAAHAFLAFKHNGDLMRVRDKGPLWIVFPWSEHPELASDRIRTWAVWQLTRLEVLSP
jgi:hypothetical protein